MSQSHTVTVTRTTTTSSTTAITLNIGFLKTVNGCLKLAETILGAVCLGLVAYYSTSHGMLFVPENLMFFLVAFAFLVMTFLLFISALLSLMTATILPKSLFEFLYHVFAFIFYLSSSIALLVLMQRGRMYIFPAFYRGYMAASVLGLGNAVLYFLSAFFSLRDYRAG